MSSKPVEIRNYFLPSFERLLPKMNHRSHKVLSPKPFRVSVNDVVTQEQIFSVTYDNSVPCRNSERPLHPVTKNRNQLRNIGIDRNKNEWGVAAGQVGESFDRAAERLHRLWRDTFLLAVANVHYGVSQRDKHRPLVAAFLSVVDSFDDREDAVQEHAVVHVMRAVEADRVRIVARKFVESACYEGVVNAEHAVNSLAFARLQPEVRDESIVRVNAFEAV